MSTVNRRHSDDYFEFPVLIGDIGGTNARFALVVDANAEPKSFPVVQTADFPNIDDAIQAAVLDQTSLIPRSIVLAVAGPVDGDEVDLTNCDWVIRPRVMIERFGVAEVIVLNDFEAQALAVAALGEEHLHAIGGGEISDTGSKVVLGPGTGLGVAGLVNAHSTWIPVPGEGGHMDIGPRSARDFEVFPHFERINGRVSGEQLLCGRGIMNIYRAVHAADGTTPVLPDPAAVTSAALDGTDAAAVETLELFLTYLARVAGDLALVFMARGGVYLSGGIIQKVLPAVSDVRFRAAFDDKAPHEDLMRAIPVFVVTHPLAALQGLAAYSRTPARFGVATEGRRWS
jgi:glucokinase